MTIKDDKERRLLDAAADVFRSPDYDLFSDVQYERIAELAGYSSRTVRDAFTGKPELHHKLVEHMLTLDETAVTAEAGAISAPVADRAVSFTDAVIGIGAAFLAHNRVDPMFRSQMALWPYSCSEHTDGQGSQHITDTLSKLYKKSGRNITAEINTMFIEQSDHFQVERGWLTSDEFTTLATAIIEGLAIRSCVDPDDVPDDLPGRALLALLATMIKTDDGSDDPRPAVIVEIDRLRKTDTEDARD